MAAKMADPEWLGGISPSLHHHWFGFPSTSPAPPLPDLLWYLPSSPVAPPGPQPQTCLGDAVWISMLDVVEYERQDGVREGKQWRGRERDRKQNTEYKAHPRQLFLHQHLFLSHTTHKHTHTNNLCTSAWALIWVCLRPPSMTSSWEKRTRSEGGQDRQRKSGKAVNKWQ